ncbi:MAG: hypothetical protein HUJ80_00985, partial [Firmicutes bacterium]|nr:hypothetical protein [Bacillota bacterium]
MIITPEITRMESILKEMQKSDTMELQALPEDLLHWHIKRGARHAYAVSFRNGKRTRIDITRKPQEIIKLLRADYLRAELSHVEAALDTLHSNKQAFSDWDRSMFFAQKIKEYDGLDPKLIEQALTHRSEAVDDWSQAPYKRSDLHPEGLIHITSRGLRVRSKNELLIAEKLYENGISFRYEQELMADGRILYPDFTIKKRSGAICYWEHFGMMHDERYRE